MQVVAAIGKSIKPRADLPFVGEVRPVLDLLWTKGAQERPPSFNRDVTVQGQKQLGAGRLKKVKVEFDRGGDFPGLIVGKDSRPKPELIDVFLLGIARMEAEAEIGGRGVDVMRREAGSA